jgi:hypothetical protein
MRELCKGPHDYRSNGPVLIGAYHDGRDIRMGPAVCADCGHIAVDVRARRLT